MCICHFFLSSTFDVVYFVVIPKIVLYSYEPELHPGVTYKLKNPKATLKIFSTGSVTVTGK